MLFIVCTVILVLMYLLVFRLGPGRIHHCMRAIGFGERALAIALRRITTRKAFGKLLAEV